MEAETARSTVTVGRVGEDPATCQHSVRVLFGPLLTSNAWCHAAPQLTAAAWPARKLTVDTTTSPAFTPAGSAVDG
jgi:hypothetical protein